MKNSLLKVYCAFEFSQLFKNYRVHQNNIGDIQRNIKAAPTEIPMKKSFCLFDICSQEYTTGKRPNVKIKETPVKIQSIDDEKEYQIAPCEKFVNNRLVFTPQNTTIKIFFFQLIFLHNHKPQQ